MFYVVSLQLNAASEMSKALKHFLKGKQRIRFGSCIDFIIDIQNIYDGRNRFYEQIIKTLLPLSELEYYNR